MMRIQTSQDGDITLVEITDRLEADTVSAFRDAMAELAAAGKDRLVLNLREVTLIDSSGLGGLVAVLRQFRQKNGDIKLACITDYIRPLIEIVRLHRIFFFSAINSFYFRPRSIYFRYRGDRTVLLSSPSLFYKICPAMFNNM